MTKDIDCQFFEDQLDALSKGDLPADAVGLLRAHALDCPACGMMLRVKEHLLSPSLEELEEAVPVEHLDSMWPRLEAVIHPSPWGRRWIIPTLAAASVLFLFSTGFLASALMQSTNRETGLTRQIADLEYGLARLDARTEWIDRTAQLAGSRGNRARALDYALAGQETVSLPSLLEILGRYPDDKVLFQKSAAESLSRSASPSSKEIRGLLTLLDSALSDLGEVDEVRVGDFARWLSEASLPIDLEVPKSTLMELLSL